MAEKKNTWKKVVVGATAVSLLGLGIGVGLGGKDSRYTNDPVKHDNDTLIVHVENGRTIKDVGLLYDKSDDIEFDSVSLISKDMPNTYLVDPAKDDDSRLAEIIDLLEDDGDVLDAEYNMILSIPEGESIGSASSNSDVGKGPNDPLYQEGKLWGMTAIGMEKVYAGGFKPKKVAKVYVLDTGISKHEDLEAKLYVADGHGHGTHCSGTIAGITNNGKGVSSLDPDGKFIDIYGKKVLSDSGSGSISRIAKAIIEAANEGADVISMSLGGSGTSRVLDDAIAYANKKGTVVVVAAGNSNADAKYFSPANSPGAITVAAVGKSGDGVKRASFSNYGEIVEVAAPGVDIWSTVPKNNRMKRGYDFISINGTSMACPHDAAVAGMMISVNPDLRGNTEAIVKIQQDTGSDPTTESGKPIGKFINAYGAIKAAKDHKSGSNWGLGLGLLGVGGLAGYALYRSRKK